MHSGIGLETSILFAKEGASVWMVDIRGPALEEAMAKVLQLVPYARRVEISVSAWCCSREREAYAALWRGPRS